MFECFHLLLHHPQNPRHVLGVPALALYFLRAVRRKGLNRRPVQNLRSGQQAFDSIEPLSQDRHLAGQRHGNGEHPFHRRVVMKPWTGPARFRTGQRERIDIDHVRTETPDRAGFQAPNTFQIAARPWSSG